MFGRRNPDQTPTSVPPAPAESENDVDLDLMPDFPPIPADSRPEPAPEPAPEPPADPVWHASAMPSPAQTGWDTPASSPLVSPAPTQPVISWQPPVEDLSVSETAFWVTPTFEEAETPPETHSAVEQELAMNTQPSEPAMPPPVATPAAPVMASAVAETKAVDPPVTQRTKQVSESVIGPDDFFDGRYRSERGVRIQGNARGSIESRQYIFVEGGAEVEAELSAEDITVAGSFNGKIECRRRLEITSTGKVQGQVTTALLVVEEGGVIDGELHMRSDEPKAEQS